MLGGKLAAEVIAERAIGLTPSKGMKQIQPNVIEKVRNAVPRDPMGVNGKGAIAFGGGAVLTTSTRADLLEVDPEQFVG